MLTIHDKTLLFFDIETTGISRYKNDIIEYAGLKIFPDGDVETLECRMHPVRKPDGWEESCAINGYSYKLWEEYGNLYEQHDALKAIVEFSRCTVLIGHNINKFDVPFVEQQCQHYAVPRRNVRYLPRQTVDTLELAKTLMDTPSVERYSQSYLCDLFGISTKNGHSAMYDVIADHALFFEVLLPLANGETTLDHCLQKCGQQT